jgi:hypothetical protein
MNRSKRSVEFQHYCKTLSCPQGHRGTLISREGAGEILTNLQLRDRMLLEHPTPAIAGKIPGLSEQVQIFQSRTHRSSNNHRFREDSELECIQCNKRWPIFLDESATFDIIREHDQHRLETPLGTDTRLAGGRNSVKDSSLTFTFERQWFQRIEFEWEELTAYGVGGEATIAVPLPNANLLAKLKL